MHPGAIPGAYGQHPSPHQAGARRSRGSALLIGAAVLVLVGAAIASIILAATGG